jgi:endonuclease-3
MASSRRSKPRATKRSAPARTSPKRGSAATKARSPRGAALADRVPSILSALKAEFPAPRCALDHETPLQLLVATILSAQCTDERVNRVTPALFAKYPDAEAFAGADPSDLEERIRSTGFFRNKTKSILGATRLLVDKHGGIVPHTMEELLELPGVARKTANVVLGVAFNTAVGVVVDTHVSRISRLLHLTRQTDAVKIERDLMEVLPRKEWIAFSHRLILHGRKTCIARRPRCAVCRLAPWCPSRSTRGGVPAGGS